jgi:hypothetical protein
VNRVIFLVLVVITLQIQAGEVVEQMRGLSMQLQGIAPGNGRLSQMRRNAALVLTDLGGGYFTGLRSRFKNGSGLDRDSMDVTPSTLHFVEQRAATKSHVRDTDYASTELAIGKHCRVGEL